MMKRKSTALILLLVGLFFFTACRTENPEKNTEAEEERNSYFPYRKMKELSTSSNDVKKLEEIVRALPEIETYLPFKEAELSEDRKELILKYDRIGLKEQNEKLPKYMQPGASGYISPHFDARCLNNALLLLLIKENLETVRYDIPEGYTDRNGNPEINSITYSRSKLSRSLGDLNMAQENPDYYHTLLEYHNAVRLDPSSNMTTLGVSEKWVREIGEPDEKMTEPGEEEPSIYRYYWEDRKSYTDYRLSRSTEEEDRILMEVSVYQDKDFREEDYNQEGCLLRLPESEYLKKEYIRSYYGTPKMSYENTDYYRLNTGLSDYLYFNYNEKGEVLRYGSVRKSVRTRP